jgi:hypothetical protein
MTSTVKLDKKVAVVMIAALTISFVVPQTAPNAIASEELLDSSIGQIRSDFNGDGFADLAIGVPVSSGSVHVLYGSSSGLQTSSPADQIWTSASSGIDATGQTFGSAMAAGDYNADGYSDLALGVNQETVSGVPDAGAVEVIYGSSAGLRATAAGDGTGRSDQLWTQNSPGLEDNAEFFDLFGSILASGDFNGDNADDLAITSTDEDLGSGKSNAGVVHVIYGGSQGLQTSSPAPDFWHQDSPGVEETAESEESFGRALAVSDFDGDGNDDLAISAWSEDLGDNGGQGVVHILYGSSSGLQTGSPTDQLWHQNKPGVNDSAEPNDNFGWALTASDFNGDGFGDLAISVPSESVGTKAGAGAVNVLYGSENGLQTASPADQFWHQNVAGVEEMNEIGDSFGYALTSGDYNGDGFGDLAVGVPHDGTGGVADAGVVNVIYGSSSGLQTSSPVDQLWHQDVASIEETAEPKERFGLVLSSGDFNGDGEADLVAGTPYESVGSFTNAGALNVIYGSSSGLTSSGDQLWHQDSPGVNGEAGMSRYFGSSISSARQGTIRLV